SGRSSWVFPPLRCRSEEMAAPFISSRRRGSRVSTCCNLYRVDGADGSTREIGSIPSASGGRISVEAGVARVVARGEAGVVLAEARGDEMTVLGQAELFHWTRFEPSRPTWNGADVIVVGRAGFFGPLRV